MPASLSRQLAKFICNLSYDDLPPEVVDKAKALTLQGLASALIGSQYPAAQRTIHMIKEEETVARGGSTLMVDGAKLTKAGAAFANSELVHTGAKVDSYRMLTHPGTTIIPAALVAAEAAGSSGKEFITGLTLGYEVQERISRDWIPSTQARGFRSSPIYGIFGAGVAAGKLMGLDEDQMNSAIALCVNLASGNLEGARSGGQPTSAHEPSAARNAMLAVLLAKEGLKGGETVLEGDAGFYHSYAGNNNGKLSYVFTGRKTTSPAKVTSGLGRQWEIMNTVHRIYSTGGFNLPHVDVTAKLCDDNDIKPQDVERVEAVVNWLETLYPSPAFPTPSMGDMRVGSPHYFSAYAILKRGYPVLVKPGQPLGPGGGDNAPPEVLEMMKKVTLIPSKTQTSFGPKITIYTRNGKSYTAESTGREFMWDLKEETRRIRELVPGLPIPKSQFEEIITAVSGLDKLPKADKLIQLTLLKQATPNRRR